MPSIGIRELKNETSEIIRAVREEQAEYVITYRGQPVAVILPVDEATRLAYEEHILAGARAQSEASARLDALAAEIDAAWQSDKSAVELVEEQRREL